MIQPDTQPLHEFWSIQYFILDKETNRINGYCKSDDDKIAERNNWKNKKEKILKIASEKKENNVLKRLLNNADDDKSDEENITKGADVNLYQKAKSSPLYIACQNGNYSMVEFLIKNNADVNLCTSNGFSPLAIAFTKGYKRIVQFLIENGADVNLYRKNISRPLSEQRKSSCIASSIS